MSASTQPPLLLNPLATPEQIALTPSRRDGLPEDLEGDLRAYGAVLIQRMGCGLELPQRVNAVAQVLFQRFWYASSMRQFSVSDVSVAALFLATKVEEYPIRLRDLINVFDYFLQKDRWAAQRSDRGPWRLSEAHTTSGEIATDEPSSSSSQARKANAQQETFSWKPHSYHSSVYYGYRDSLVVHEMQILKRLGFQLESQLPYSTLINYLNVLELGKARGLVQRCWSICTDMLQSSLPALYPPHCLAVASIYYVSTLPDSSMPALPLDPHPWWILFDATYTQLQEICACLAHLYDEERGTASRVREEWGGCVELSSKAAVRQWLEEQQKEQPPDESPVK